MYFEADTNKEVKIQTVWEAHKAVLRGIQKLIILNNKDKKQKQERFQQLQAKIIEKEIEWL